MDLGTYLEYDGRPAVRFERTYPHPIDRVWAAVSTPVGLAGWFPSKVDIEPRAGGTIAFSGDPNVDDATGVVLAFDPLKRLAFTWGNDELHFELEPVGRSTCRLVLINVLGDRSSAARNAAGWSVCLAELDKTMAESLTWQDYYDAYVASGLPSGAPIPGR
jgi:uncharacterized protein YndB with AHSA1/START domain